MSYTFLREKRFLYGSHGGYFTGVGAGSASFRSKRESQLFDSRFLVNNASQEDNASEEEWRKLFEGGNLIEKAVELVRQGYRYPKPMYEYSPDGPSPEPYEVPYGTVLIPNPSPPRGKDGRLIHDSGSDVPFHSSKSVLDAGASDGPSIRRLKKRDKTTKARFLSKSLQSLGEIDESPLDRPTLRSRLASQMSKEEYKSGKSDSDSKSTKCKSDKSDSDSKSTKYKSDKSDSDLKSTKYKSDKSDSDSKSTTGKENRKPHVKASNLLTDDRDTGKSSSIDVFNRTQSLTVRSKTTPLSTIRNDSANTSADDMFDTPRDNRSLSAYTGRERFKTRSERLKEVTASANDLSDKKPSDRSTVFRSESVFEVKKEKISALPDNDEQSKRRRPSFMASLQKEPIERPKSTYDYIREIYKDRLADFCDSPKEDSQKTNKTIERSTTYRRSQIIYTNAELTQMDNKKDNTIEGDKNKGTNLKDTSKTIIETKEGSTSSSSQEKAPQSQDYIPNKRIPLKQRLINKMSSTSTDQTDEDTDGAGGGHTSHTAPFNTPLIPRAASQFANQEEQSKSNEKDDSLKSRFLRRFRIGSEDKKEERKEGKDRKSRKKSHSDHSVTESSQDERNERESERRRGTYEEVKPSAYDSYSTRALRMSVDHRLASIDINMENMYTTGTSLAEILVKEEEKAGIDMSRYLAYSPDVKKKFLDRKKSVDTTGRRDDNLDTSESTDSCPKSPRKLRKKEKEAKKTNNDQPCSPRKSRKNEKEDAKKTGDGNTQSPKKSRKKGKESKNETQDTDSPKSTRKSRDKKREEEKQYSVCDNTSVMSFRDRHKDYLKEPKSEFQKDDLPSPKGIMRRIHHTYTFDKKKKGILTNDSDDSSNSDSEDRFQKRNRGPRVYEYPIRPILKSENIRLDFRSPRASFHEKIIEEITTVTLVDHPMKDDMFNVLLQREVSVESLNIVCTGEEEASTRINTLFEQMSQLSFDSYHASASSELSLTELTSSEQDARDSDAAIGGSCVSEYARTIVTTIDDLNEQKAHITNGVESRNISSERMFTMIESASNDLYSEVFNLTKSVKENEKADETGQCSNENSSSIENDVDCYTVLSTSKVSIDNHNTNTDMNLGNSEKQDTIIHNIPSISIYIKNEENINETKEVHGESVDNDADINKIATIRNDYKADLTPEGTNGVRTDMNFDNSIVFQGTDDTPSMIAIEDNREMTSKDIDVRKTNDKNMKSGIRAITNLQQDKEEASKDKDIEGTHLEEKDDPGANSERDKKLESSPFKLTRMEKKKSVTREEVKTSFDNAVEATAEDVNNMIHKCNSIDEINNDIQRSHNSVNAIEQPSQPKSQESSPSQPKSPESSPSQPKSPESSPSQPKSPESSTPRNKSGSQVVPNDTAGFAKIETGGVQLRLRKRDASENIPLCQRRFSLVEKRLSLLQGQKDGKYESNAPRPKSLVEKDGKYESNVPRPKSLVESSKSLFNNGATIAATIKLVDVAKNTRNKTNSEVSKSDALKQNVRVIGSTQDQTEVKNGLVMEIRQEQITVSKKYEEPKNIKLQITKQNEQKTSNSIRSKHISKTKSPPQSYAIVGGEHTTNTITKKSNDGKENKLLDSTKDVKSVSTTSSVSLNNHKQASTNEELNLKSMNGNQSSRTKVTTEEATSSSVKVDEGEEKKVEGSMSRSPSSSKSLADIKSRISAIKARREALSKLTLTGKKDTLIVTEVADI